MVPELGHLLLQRHQSPADFLDLVVGERAIIHSPQGLPLHQLAQQLHDGENHGHQAPLDRLRVRVDAMALYRRALLPGCQGAHRPGTFSSSPALIRALADVTSARSETLTMSTSAMASVTSTITTPPPASTRSSRSTRAIRSVWMAGRCDWRGLVTAVGTSTGSSSCGELT